jgi:hypothetical protein
MKTGSFPLSLNDLCEQNGLAEKLDEIKFSNAQEK